MNGRERVDNRKVRGREKERRKGKGCETLVKCSGKRERQIYIT